MKTILNFIENKIVKNIDKFLIKYIIRIMGIILLSEVTGLIMLVLKYYEIGRFFILFPIGIILFMSIAYYGLYIPLRMIVENN